MKKNYKKIVSALLVLTILVAALAPKKSEAALAAAVVVAGGMTGAGVTVGCVFLGAGLLASVSVVHRSNQQSWTEWVTHYIHDLNVRIDEKRQLLDVLIVLDGAEGQVPEFKEITPEMQAKLGVDDETVHGWKHDLHTLNNDKESYMADILSHDPSSLTQADYQTAWDRYFSNASPASQEIFNKLRAQAVQEDQTSAE